MSTPVTTQRPESPITTSGTDHITIWGSNEADTVGFYRDLLGMPLVLRQPNLDAPDQTHLFFDTGDGRILTVFVGDRPSNRRGIPGATGAVHHLCFSVEPDSFEATIEAVEADGRGYNVFDRGIFLSVYTHDNNGLVIELTTDKYPIPADRRGRCSRRRNSCVRRREPATPRTTISPGLSSSWGWMRPRMTCPRRHRVSPACAETSARPTGRSGSGHPRPPPSPDVPHSQPTPSRPPRSQPGSARWPAHPHPG
jgi:Lactoylglutathione lyase and related lyases